MRARSETARTTTTTTATAQGDSGEFEAKQQMERFQWDLSTRLAVGLQKVIGNNGEDDDNGNAELCTFHINKRTNP